MGCSIAGWVPTVAEGGSRCHSVVSMWRIAQVCESKGAGPSERCIRSLECIDRQAQHVNPGARLSSWEPGYSNKSGEAVGCNKRSRIVNSVIGALGVRRAAGEHGQ